MTGTTKTTYVWRIGITALQAHCEAWGPVWSLSRKAMGLYSQTSGDDVGRQPAHASILRRNGFLTPAFRGTNGYRLYEERQLLTLQTHREVLQKDLRRSRTLIETIDKTITHLKGAKKMKK
jgi:hypothetical protein